MANPYRQHIIDLVRKKPHTFTYQQVADRFGITFEQVRNVARQNNLVGLFVKRGDIITQASTLKGHTMKPEDIKEVIAAERKERIARDNAFLYEKKYKVLLKEYERIERERDDMLAVNAGRVVKHTIKPREKSSHGEAVPCLVWSDWHSEEKVDPRTIGGKNKYTLDIARDRATRIAQSSQKLMLEDAQNTNINDVALFLLGDFITGNIHKENVENAQLIPVDATLYAQGLLESNLDFLLANTPYNYHVYCKVGNHSRITERVHASTEMGNSLELALYVGMKRHYADKPRVKFHIEPSYFSIVNILGTRVRFHHGHAVSYGGGVGGLHIPLRKAIKSWNETERADFDIMGHYHSFLEHTTMRYMVNGSLIGYNAYAERIKAVLERPLQGYCLVHKKYGVTRMTPVFAD